MNEFQQFNLYSKGQALQAYMESPYCTLEVLLNLVAEFIDYISDIQTKAKRVLQSNTKIVQKYTSMGFEMIDPVHWIAKPRFKKKG